MSIRIGMGPGLGDTPEPEDYWRWVELCERAGIDSLWHSDQLLGPTLEPMAMLAALAGRTRRMRFGTNAVVIAQRDPVLLAKQIATIDFLSGGRVLPVFGVGNKTDAFWQATGADASARGRRGNEAIRLVRELLENESVAFEGSFFQYWGPGIRPRPQTRIPLWIGGHSPAAIARTAALGDGWLGGLVTPERAGEARRAIEAALIEHGRAIDADHYGVTVPFRIGSRVDVPVAPFLASFRRRTDNDVDGDALAIGSAGEVIARFREFVDAGMSKFVAVPIIADAADRMAQTEALAAHVLPAIEDRG